MKDKNAAEEFRYFTLIFVCIVKPPNAVDKPVVQKNRTNKECNVDYAINTVFFRCKIPGEDGNPNKSDKHGDSTSYKVPQQINDECIFFGLRQLFNCLILSSSRTTLKIANNPYLTKCSFLLFACIN